MADEADDRDADEDDRASAKVTMMWLVIVKLYGTSPNRLANRMNTNSVNTNGKNCRAPCPALVSTMSATNS